MSLTPYFLLSEFLGTDTGLPNAPGPAAECALRALCSAVLLPWRERVGPLKVTSGYRSEAVNDELRRQGRGASRSSQHLRGEAADVVPRGMGRLEAWAELLALVEACLPVDQAILYETTDHIHVSHTARHVARRDLRVRVRVPIGGRLYIPWDDYTGELRP